MGLPDIIKPLTDKQLETASRLAASGCRPALIRTAIGGPTPIPPGAWRALLAPDKNTGDPSPLAVALETGAADLAQEVVAFFLSKMRDGDSNAARWLGERVCKFKDEEQETAPRIQINIVAPMSETEYRKEVDFEITED